MSLLHTLLGICTISAQLLLLAFGWVVLAGAYRRLRYEQPFSFGSIIAGYRDRLLKNPRASCILAFVIVAGTINMILTQALSSTQIGAFYEKSTYQETYEATLYLNDKPIFCLVDMRREIAEDVDSRGRIKTDPCYWLDHIYLPYGKSAPLNSEYEPGHRNYIELLGDGQIAEITLERPKTETAEERLKAEVITAYGPYCASKEGDLYHYRGCGNTKRIKVENMIFFESEYEAAVFGYTPCDRCVGS